MNAYQTAQAKDIAIIAASFAGIAITSKVIDRKLRARLVAAHAELPATSRRVPQNV